MPRSYPAEFRRKVLDLLKAGRTVTQLSNDLQISGQTIYVWRRQEAIDNGELPGVNATELAELSKARRRIAELEAELAIHRRATDLLKEAVPPKARFAAIRTLAAEGFSVDLCCRVLDVSVSGYYAWRSRPASERSLRHAWPTERIRAVHMASRGTYGAPRVHAELRLGHGIIVGHNSVELLMRRAGLKGLPVDKYRRPLHQTPTARRLGQPRVHPRRTGPVVGHRHHRTPHPRGEGLLRCRARLVLPPRGRLVHQRITDLDPGDERAEHGDQQPPPVGLAALAASAGR